MSVLEAMDAPVPQSVDVETLRAATGAWATGVVVVTAAHPDGRDAGLVMVSLAPVSQEPPLVLWSVDRGSSSLDVWLGAPGYALHLLAAEQEALAWQFARKGAEKFDGLTVTRGLIGAPLLDGAAAMLECAMHAQHDGGDHIILVGRVVATTVTDRSPLVMHAGRMRGLPPESQ
ncbi:MAG: flavin reductase family protein [Thermoleophilia bacterium]|nr:flavin reductase family protein [Thermoleophilia bacterium]